MKKKNYLLMSLFCCSTIALNTACSSDEGSDEDQTIVTDPVKTELINDYIDITVLPTYTDMKEKVWTLLEKVEVFTSETGGTQAQLDAVCAAWRTAREPWEKSEGFLYGPADAYHLDPHMDSWPLDRTNIEAIISSNIDLSTKADFAQDECGFHTIEYLIFVDGQSKDASTVTARQKEYLLAITKVLRDDIVRLWSEWHGVGSDVPERDLAVIEDREITIGYGDDGYATLMRNPSMYGLFKTQNSVISNIIENGLMNIAGEVGTQKIGNPYQTKDVYAVESWQSWNSLDDYENNIISIENSYLGGPEATRKTSTSLSAYVKTKNTTLDKEVTDNIAAARTAIRAIPYPFRNNLDKSVPIENAMTKLADLTNSLEKLKGLFTE